MAFFAASLIIKESSSNDADEDPSIELLCLWNALLSEAAEADLAPNLSSPPAPPPAPVKLSPSKKSESTERLRKWLIGGEGLEDESSESTAMEVAAAAAAAAEAAPGTAPPPRDGVGVVAAEEEEGRSRPERSRSEASKRRKSSRRKVVSEWARRWCEAWRCGVSGIWSMMSMAAAAADDAAMSGGFAENCGGVAIGGEAGPAGGKLGGGGRVAEKGSTTEREREKKERERAKCGVGDGFDGL